MTSTNSPNGSSDVGIDHESTPEDTPEDTQNAPPEAPETYAMLDPQCPICGNTRFKSTSEEIPNEMDSHYVNATCARCYTYFTIEYRAIDVFWYGGGDDQHSAVSQGILEPNNPEYADEINYSELPDSDLLWNLDWPFECDCGERLTGNALITDPKILGEHDIDYGDPENKTILFHCVNCETITSRTLSTDA